MAQTRERVLWIDALRGAAILMVVAAHAIAAVLMHASPAEGRIAFQGAWIDAGDVNHLAYNLIASVYMPLFAFVSGLLQGRSGLRVTPRTLQRRAGGLMVPYLAWLLVGALLAFSTVVADPLAWLQGFGQALLDPRSTGLWFLYALFMVQALVALVTGVSARPRALVLTSAALMLLLITQVPNLLGIRDVAWLFPFFAMGMLEAQSGFLERRSTVMASAGAYPLLLAVMWPTIVETQRWWIPGAREFLLWLPFVPQVVTDWTPVLVVHFGRYACAAAGIVLLHSLYVRMPHAAVAPQAFVGQRSLGIYALHPRFLVALTSAGITSATVLFALATIGALAVTLVLERTPVASRLLLGQRARRDWRRGGLRDRPSTL